MDFLGRDPGIYYSLDLFGDKLFLLSDQINIFHCPADLRITQSTADRGHTFKIWTQWCLVT